MHPQDADAKRIARSKRFDSPTAAPITATREGLRITYADLSGPVFPVGLSDLIVVANVENAVTYLTASRTCLYTEYTAEVISALKHDGAALPTKLILLQRGGEGHLPDGHPVKHIVRGGLPPFIEYTRNILFLKYFPDADAYEVSTAWRSDNGIVKPLLASDAESAKVGQFPYTDLPEEVPRRSRRIRKRTRTGVLRSVASWRRRRSPTQGHIFQGLAHVVR